MADYSRKHYRDIGLKPYLFYVVFGVDNPTVSMLPKGIELISINKTEHTKYTDALLSKETKASLILPDETLLSRCAACESWAVVHGRIENDSDLEYLKIAADALKMFCDGGAAGIMDVQSKRLYSPEAYAEKLIKNPADAYANVSMVRTKFDGGSEFRTHGLLKYGRPDILCTNIPSEFVNDCAELISQMVYYSAQGAFFDAPVRLQSTNGKEYTLNPVLSKNGDTLHIDWSKNK